MNYYFSKKLKTSFENAEKKVVEELKKEGFGVLTEIDVKEKLKEKIDVDFRKYKILGVCNPSYAHKALLAEDKIGTMLPCNVIIQETDDNMIEVAAINPIASMMAVENESLGPLAEEIKVKLENVIRNLT